MQVPPRRDDKGRGVAEVEIGLGCGAEAQISDDKEEREFGGQGYLRFSSHEVSRQGQGNSVRLGAGEGYRLVAALLDGDDCRQC